MKKEPSNDLFHNIILKALKDNDFKAMLLKNPKETIEKELNVSIPKDIEIEIIEDTEKKRYLHLPYLSEEMSDEELETIAGGGWKDAMFYLLGTPVTNLSGDELAKKWDEQTKYVTPPFFRG